MRRRTLLFSAPALALGLAACGNDKKSEKQADTSAKQSAENAGSGEGFTLTDIAGREVKFAKQPTRIVLGESRHVYSLLFLNKENPTENIVAWGQDLQRAAGDIYSKLLEVHPEVKDIPTIGSVHKGDLTVESLLSFKPDAILFTLDAYRAGEKNGLVEKMDAAKLPYVVTDFRQDPVKNTLKSVDLIAAVCNRRDQAKEFAAYYKQAVDPILEAAKKVEKKPTTFLWRAPGLAPACATFSKANLGLVVTETGGDNIADPLLEGDNGVLTPEQIIASNPTNIIATGGEWGSLKINEKAQTSYVHLGYAASPESAKKSLEDLQKQPGFDKLKAFTERNVFGIYHQFYDAPFNFVAFQAFAKWQHPEVFKDVDPSKNWEDFNDKYLPWKASGVFVTGIR
ncbi:ABC transporter substrate-binding protein [Dermabacteraceae bacterium CCM 9519]